MIQSISNEQLTSKNVKIKHCDASDANLQLLYCEFWLTSLTFTAMVGKLAPYLCSEYAHWCIYNKKGVKYQDIVLTASIATYQVHPRVH